MLQLAIVLALALFILRPIGDPDLWWHLVSGRWILANGQVPRVDHWTIFGSGKPWQAYSWSFELIVAQVELLLGMQGLIALKLLFAVLLVWSLFRLCYRLAGEPFVAGMIASIACVSMMGHFALRPQTISWILLAWVIVVGARVRENGFTLGRGMLLLCFGMLWANNHITAIFGLLAAIVWSAGRLREMAGLQRGFKAGTWFFFGSVLTPYLGAEWGILASKFLHPSEMRDVSEFAAASVLQDPIVPVVMLAAVLVVFLVQKPRAVELEKLLYAGVLLVGGFSVVKIMPYAAVILAAVLAELWQKGEDGAALGQLAEGLRKLREVSVKLSPVLVSGLLLLFVIGKGVSLAREPVYREGLPEAAYDFVLSNKLSHPILNAFGDGGYLMYRLADAAGKTSELVSLDGRTNVPGIAVLRAYQDAWQGSEDWQRYFELMQPETVLWPNKSALVLQLVESKEWCQVYRDGDEELGWTVFVKVSSAKSTLCNKT